MWQTESCLVVSVSNLHSTVSLRWVCWLLACRPTQQSDNRSARPRVPRLLLRDWSGLARSHWWVSGRSVDWLGHTGESLAAVLTGSVTLVSLWPQCWLARSHWWVSGGSVDWLGHTGESQCCFLLRQCCLCSDQSSLSLISVILWRNGANFVGIVEISFSIGLVWAGFSVSHWRGLVQTSHVWDPSLASVCITRWTTLADWEKRRFVVENDVLRVYVADGDERKGKPEITRKTSIFYEESK